MTNARADRGTSVSTVLGRRLGGELLRMREGLGLRQAAAAEALTASVPKVAKMERGLVPMRDPDIRALCHLYGVEDEEAVADLLRLARLDRERRRAKGWWKRDPDPMELAEYIAMEDVAARIRTWQLSLVPGLFQTADYARALAVSGGVWEDPDGIEAIVAVRMKRQARLTGVNPPKVHAIVWEAALRQLVGGAEVMRGQLDHLLSMAKLPNIHIQVLPFRAGGHPCITGPFNIVSFADRAAADVVHTDTITSTQWVEDVDQSAAYVAFFEQTARLSLAPHASVQLIDIIGRGMQT